MAIAAFVLVAIPLLVRYRKTFIANIAMLLGLVAGCLLAVALGKMSDEKVGNAQWSDVVTPSASSMPTFDVVMTLTMTLVMIESTGMFLALSNITDRPLSRKELSAGLRTDGLRTTGGGVFNTFLYTSLSQNVRLVGVAGVAAVNSRWVRAGAGMIPPVAPRWTQPMAHGLHPRLASGILLSAIATVLLNLHVNGGRHDEAAVIGAAKTAEAH